MINPSNIDLIIVSVLLPVWLGYMFWPRTTKYTGIIAKRTSGPFWALPFLIGGGLIDTFANHRGFWSWSFKPLHNHSWALVACDGIFLVLIIIDWWSENDRPKKLKKRVAELAKKFQLKPIPKPVINLS